MRKDQTNFNIRMNKDEGFVVKTVRGYLVNLPFGYTGVVHRPFGYVKGGKKYWCVSEFITGCLILAGDTGGTRPATVDVAHSMICKMGRPRFEMGVHAVLRDFELDEVN